MFVLDDGFNLVNAVHDDFSIAMALAQLGLRSGSRGAPSLAPTRGCKVKDTCDTVGASDLWR